MSEIFISYSRKDEDVVDALAADLERKGLDVYYDKRLKPGQDFEKALSEKLEGARYVLVALSPDALASRNVRSELKRALRRERERRTTVIPILVRPCDPQALRRLLGPKQYADFTEDYRAGLEELSLALADAKQAAGVGEVATEGEERKQMAADRKTPIIVALIAGAVALTTALLPFILKSSPSPEQKISYQGRVINRDTDQTIKGARVSLEAAGVEHHTYADSNGIFHFDLAGGTKTIRVRVEAGDYEPFNELVTLTEGKFGDVRLAPKPTPPQPTPTSTPGSPPHTNRGGRPTHGEPSPPRPREDDASNLEKRRREAKDILNNSNRQR